MNNAKETQVGRNVWLHRWRSLWSLMRWNGLKALRCCNSGAAGTGPSRPPPSMSCDCATFAIDWTAVFTHQNCTICHSCAMNECNDIWWITFAGLSRSKESSKFWGRRSAESLFMRHTDLWANVISNADIWIKAQWGDFLDPIQSPVSSFHYIWRLISLLRKAASLSRLKVFPCVFY